MSSASTYAYSSHPNDTDNRSLPSYSQVVEMKEFASAPLLEDRPQSIFGNATSFKFEFDSGDSFDYSFLIRDTVGRLHAKGYVSNTSVTLKGINGSEILQIFKKEGMVHETTASIFGIRQDNVEIGSVKIDEKAPAERCLQIFHKSNHPPLIVRSLKLGDFAIFRESLPSTPLCNIQMPNTDVYNFGEFNGTIIFETETGVTAQEQLLCTSAAIAFKVTTKQVIKKANDDGKFTQYLCATCCCVVFIGVLVIFFIIMEKWGCEHKKSQGYAGYVHRQC